MAESQWQESPATGMIEVLGRGLVPVSQVRDELLRWSIGEGEARAANAEYRVHETQVAVLKRAAMPAALRNARGLMAIGFVVFLLGVFRGAEGGLLFPNLVVGAAIGSLVGVFGPWRVISDARKAIPLVRVEPVRVRLGQFPGLSKPGQYLLPAGDPDAALRGVAAIAYVIHLANVPPVVLSLDVDRTFVV